MALGRTHTAINFLAICSILPFVLVYSSLNPSYIGTAMFSAAWGSLFLSPDLDLRHSNSTRMWGPLSWIWIAYSSFFSHRKMSHNIFFGTATRVCYLFACALAFFLVSLIIFSSSMGFYRDEHLFVEHLARSFFASLSYVVGLVYRYYDYFGSIFIGLLVADFIHILVDELSSFWKKIRKIL